MIVDTKFDFGKNGADFDALFVFSSISIEKHFRNGNSPKHFLEEFEPDLARIGFFKGRLAPSGANDMERGEDEFRRPNGFLFSNKMLVFSR